MVKTMMIGKRSVVLGNGPVVLSGELVRGTKMRVRVC